MVFLSDAMLLGSEEGSGTRTCDLDRALPSVETSGNRTDCLVQVLRVLAQAHREAGRGALRAAGGWGWGVVICTKSRGIFWG